MTNANNGTGDSVSGKKYIGPCFERCQMKDGSFHVLKLHVYWVSGQRHFALTEEAARSAVAG